MNKYTDIEDIQEDALSLTERVIDIFSNEGVVFKNEFNDARMQIYPLIANYLSEDTINYKSNLSIIKKLIARLGSKKMQFSKKSYVITQDDMNDGLKNYSKTEEFMGIAKSLIWGKQWYEPVRGYVKREPDTDLLASLLYRRIICRISKAPVKKIFLVNNIENLEHKHNEDIIDYHAQRIVTILKQQDSSFIPKSTKEFSDIADALIEQTNQNKQNEQADIEKTKLQDNEKPEQSAGGEELDSITVLMDKYIYPLISEAKEYRKVVSETKIEDIQELSLTRVNEKQNMEVEPLKVMNVSNKRSKP